MRYAYLSFKMQNIECALGYNTKYEWSVIIYNLLERHQHDTITILVELNERNAFRSSKKKRMRVLIFHLCILVIIFVWFFLNKF